MPQSYQIFSHNEDRLFCSCKEDTQHQPQEFYIYKLYFKKTKPTDTKFWANPTLSIIISLYIHSITAFYKSVIRAVQCKETTISEQNSYNEHREHKLLTEPSEIRLRYGSFPCQH